MAEYIERAAVLRVAHIMRQEDKGLKTAMMDIPAADVVPVVRCKDCKHRIYKHVNDWIGEIGGCSIFDHPMPTDAFCSYGEYQTNGGAANA